MSTASGSVDNFRLTSGGLAIDDIWLNQYRVGRLVPSLTKGNQSLVIDIPLRRRFHFHLTSTFLPTLCLLTIACLTLFIDEGHFEATIMVSLTTMLVMQTLQQSISEDLPKTAYIKMVDLWLIFGLIVPFVVFLVLVVVELIPADNVVFISKDNKASFWTRNKVKSWSRFLIPGFTVLFTLGYLFGAVVIFFSDFNSPV